MSDDIKIKLIQAFPRASVIDLGTGGFAWGVPEPLVSGSASLPYPLDALPPVMRDAVREVQEIVQAPLALVATCALTAVSLAAQGYVNVKRGKGLESPVSIFTLTIAESGERKSTCDAYFSGVIREYEKQQRKDGEPVLADYKADLAAWESQKAGIEAKIKKAADDPNEVQSLLIKLKDLQRNAPKAPLVPRLIYSDITQEALVHNMATHWPAVGIISAEGGTVLGAHGMSSESSARNLGTYNAAYSGEALIRDRRTSESVMIENPRLTLGIQVQESVLSDFNKKAGAVARGSGFYARMLVAWPASTQGTRFYKEQEGESWALIAFQDRIKSVLSQLPAFDQYGNLSPSVLELSEEAKAEWRQYYNQIEGMLGGSASALGDIKDVATRSAENAARIAALFHVIEYGIDGEISQDTMECAIRLAFWHLQESRRLFGELALPEDMLNAQRLDMWLLAYCTQQGVSEVSTRDAQRWAHNSLRNKDALDAAIAELEERQRVRMKTTGRSKRLIEVNPQLLKGGA